MSCGWFWTSIRQPCNNVGASKEQRRAELWGYCITSVSIGVFRTEGLNACSFIYFMVMKVLSSTQGHLEIGSL